MAYGAVPDSVDEYLQMGVTTARDSLRIFCKVIMNLYGEEFLRKPTYIDIEKLYAYHNEKHGFPGMLGSIDLQIGRAADVPFVVNNVPYKRGYYLTDGIYPQWLPHSGKRLSVDRQKEKADVTPKTIDRCIGLVDFDYAMGRSITVMGIATGALVKGCSRFEVPSQVKIDAYRLGISSLIKGTFAIRQMAYGAISDALDEHMQLGATITRKSLQLFCKAIMELYVAYRAHFSRGDHGPDPFILLEAIASNDLWI
nr:hypothetical protein [Tanacetum cinerariifolium]